MLPARLLLYIALLICMHYLVKRNHLHPWLYSFRRDAPHQEIQTEPFQLFWGLEGR